MFNYIIKTFKIFIATIIVIGAFNISVSATVLPNDVTSVNAEASSFNGITVTWNKVVGVTGYVVYKSLSDTTGFVPVSATNKTSYVSSNLETDKTYYYKVKAYINVGKTVLYSKSFTMVNARPFNYKDKFSNDVFVGDSITSRMGLYGYMNPDQLIAEGGATISRVKALLVASTVINPKRVIIMCGVNNLGKAKLNSTTFKNLYNDLVVTAKKKYQYARIIIEPIFKVNVPSDKRNSDIDICNIVIKNIASANHVAFLNTGSINVTSKSVRLTDGLHFQPTWYPTWLAFIANNIG
ncbi:MAG TPA: GDSL-type esterase/lipase family protein [Clostridium sp.]|uniref:GDSL-type esterase/lipase family protein n=1 Tax=Clostridium sp. TaxID=1506 RepID=UPI002F9366FA